MATNGAEAALSTVDCSSVLKAHQHAALAKQFAAERRYERAAKEHSQCRTYFREAKKILQKEDPDTSAALGLLSYHHKLKAKDMQKRARSIAHKPRTPAQTKHDRLSERKSKSEQKATEKLRMENSQKESTLNFMDTYQGMKTQTSTASMEIKRVLEGFKDLLGMEERMKPTASASRSRGREEEFFLIDARDRKGKAKSDMRQRSEKLKELAKENMELKKTIEDFRLKFAYLKRAMEHFKQAWANMNNSNTKQPQTTHLEEQIEELKRQCESEKAKRIKAQQELDRYMRYVQSKAQR